MNSKITKSLKTTFKRENYEAAQDLQSDQWNSFGHILAKVSKLKLSII